MLSNPGPELPERHLPLALLDEKIARFKILKASCEKRGPIVFNRIADGRARRDPDLRLVALGLDADQHIRFAHIVAESDVPTVPDHRSATSHRSKV